MCYPSTMSSTYRSELHAIMQQLLKLDVLYVNNVWQTTMFVNNLGNTWLQLQLRAMVMYKIELFTITHSHNVVWNVLQSSVVDDASITNNSYQSIEDCFAQQPRFPLSPVTIEGNESVVLPSGQQFEQRGRFLIELSLMPTGDHQGSSSCHWCVI